MPSLEEFAYDFDRTIQSRGREYFRRGSAKISGAHPEAIEGTVRGGNTYALRVGWAGGDEFTYQCACQFFRDRGEPCKHLWALLLQADKDGLLRPDGDETAPADEDEPLDEEEDYGSPSGEPRPALRLASGTTGGGEDDLGHTPDRSRGRRADVMQERRPPGDSDTNWKRQLAKLRDDLRAASIEPPPAWPENRRIVYIVDVPATVEGTGLTIELAQEAMKRDGRWDRPRGARIGRDQSSALPDPDDRQIIQMLLGARRGDWGGFYGGYEGDAPRKFVLPESAYLTTFRQMCNTGRCRLRRTQSEDSLVPLAWDEGEAWEFWAEIRTSPGGRYYLLDGSLRRGAGEAAERMAISEPQMLLRGAGGAGGLVFMGGKVARLNHFEAFALVLSLRDGMKLSVPLVEHQELMKALYAMPRLPKLDIPDELRLTESRPAPQPRLTVRRPGKSAQYDDRLIGELSFEYEGQVVKATQEAHALVDEKNGRVVYRDATLERAMLGRLLTLGFRESFDAPYSPAARTLRLPPAKLSKAVTDLASEGWHVEAEGKLYRQPGEFKLQVSSGIDWFELRGDVAFGHLRASLPKLLEALRRGERTITLDDGSIGMLPQEWLKKYLPLAGLGEQQEDHLRFTTRQVGFLDALLSSMPEATADEAFARARDELMTFGGVKPLDPPPGFTGELRAYQRDGLGWMEFLRKFGFGGCLADDMGLGKTVQVLALLEDRRRMRSENGHANGNGNGDTSGSENGAAAPAGPSLVVVPRSLVFNWKQEAARFTPGLRVLDHSSAQRDKDARAFSNHDVILTTYGTLRRDAGYFKDVDFDYLILDEAQAIKNASSESAKATRLLRGNHRLALSGTPVQNHLGELWSLFEFLNPGMMGAAAAFREAGAGAADADPQARSLLAKALRPFILRRTKEQVATELPEKTEQTLFCEMEAEQRKLYDELRDHYRASLLDRIAREGLNKAKIQILEALLRLRQAACHPGLIDKNRTGEGSAKLDTLLEHIDEVLEEGHKVLVFSQFTSMLAIVRERLDKVGTTYEYLDGKTRDRQARVERFQNDPACKLFLISLKAGGLGLNLTAAEYVFLLDPWWNPAVEAQAIDRAHRIGQTRHVFAYRLISKDTVEEKVLQLQQSKKDLADAIITADKSLIRTIGREDLEMLLS